MWLLLIPVALVGYGLLRQGVAGTKLLVAPQSYGFDFSRLELVINMQFTNPTSQSYEVRYIFLDAMIGGALVGQVRQQSDTTLFSIKPNSDNRFAVRFRPSVVGVLNEFKNLLLTGQVPPNVLIKGSTRVNGIVIPLEQTISYK